MDPKKPILIKTEEELLKHFGSPYEQELQREYRGAVTGTVSNATPDGDVTKGTITAADIRKLTAMVHSQKTINANVGDLFVDSSSMLNVYNGSSWNRAVWGEDDLYKRRNEIVYQTADGTTVHMPVPEAHKRLAELDDIHRLSREFPQIEDAYKKLLTLVKLHNNADQNPDS